MSQSIVETIGRFVRLEKRGRSYVGLCPFHAEKKPTFHVNPERGFHHCLGCNVSGDAENFQREIRTAQHRDLSMPFRNIVRVVLGRTGG